MRRIIAALIPLLALSEPVSAGDRTETIRFQAGRSSATISGSIQGYDGVNYMLGARAGQMVHVLFSPGHPACYFNFFVPGADTASHAGDVDGNEFSMRLSHSGNQRIQVYQMRNSARKGETCRYKVSVEVTGGGSAGGTGTETGSGALPPGGPRVMMAVCRDRAHQILRTQLPNVEVKYEGQRVDGTHAVNGSAFIHGIHETFQCSFNRSGTRIVHFVVNHDENRPVGGEGSRFDATGPINCALYEAQPYQTCKFGVVRKGNGTASLTVFHRDGTRRIIQFRDGEAVSSDSDAGVYGERRGDLTTVYVGSEERYEVVDAMMFGG